MVILIKKNELFFFECYYYYNYLFIFFNLFIYSKYYNHSKFYWKLNYLFRDYSSNSLLPLLNNKKINNYLNTRVDFKLNKTSNATSHISSPFLIKNHNFFTKNSFFKSKLFNLFILSNFTLISDQFKYHYNFKLFYVQNLSNDIVIVDINKFLNRWNDALSLLFNVFFYSFNLLVFGSPFFKNETLALNWNYNNFDINLWKYYFPFFVFKLNSYNSKTDFFFGKLASFGINFYLITDCFYHYKNLFYIKKKKYYSVGLININIDPWMVSYPIVSFFESLLVQLFFFKLLLLIQRQALFTKFIYFKTLWLRPLNSNIYNRI